MHPAADPAILDALMSLTRRGFLGSAAGLALSGRLAVAAGDGIQYSFVNRTGQFGDAECFWSLDSGKSWKSFAQEPAAACPRGNGRVYFRIGAAPRNFDDREALWDFIEYAYGKDGVWHGNTTQVDAFCIPITLALGDRRVGLAGPRARLFQAFRDGAPKEFRECVKGEWILSPCRAGFGRGGPHAAYFQAYIDEAWTMYARERKTPGGLWVGQATEGALTFTSLDGRKTHACKEKPDTQDAFLGTRGLATNPAFCAAINRHVLEDPGAWNDPAAFYRSEPCNWYSKFFHEHALDRKAYGFCYDDVADQAAFFSGKADRLVVTLAPWDKP